MTPTSVPAQNTDAPETGESVAPSPVEALTAAVAGFEASQKEALEVILAHAGRVQGELDLLSARPTAEQLAAAEKDATDRAGTIGTLTGERDEAREHLAARDGELSDARARITGLEGTLAAAGESATDVAAELAAANAALDKRDGELAALRSAAATDATTIKSFQDRLRSFEAAAQSIMAGIALGDAAPAAVAVPAAAPVVAPGPAFAPVVTDQGALAPLAAEPAFVDLGLGDTPAAGIVLPDLDDMEVDPFDSPDSQARAALLAAAASPVDPFDIPEQAEAGPARFSFVPAPLQELEEPTAAPEPDQTGHDAQEPAADPAGAQEDTQAPMEPSETQAAAAVDPLAFMDVDLGLDDLDLAELDATVPKVVPKIVPVYI